MVNPYPLFIHASSVVGLRQESGGVFEQAEPADRRQHLVQIVVHAQATSRRLYSLWREDAGHQVCSGWRRVSRHLEITVIGQLSVLYAKLFERYI